MVYADRVTDWRIVKPTEQQADIRDSVKAGGNHVVAAGAGTGKSTTLALTAEAVGKRGIVLTYNKNAALAIQGKLPSGWLGSTIHSLAWRAVKAGTCNSLVTEASLAMRKLDKGWRGATPWEIPTLLGIGKHPIPCVDKVGHPGTVTRNALAAMARNTVKHWCNSADHDIETRHVRVPTGVDRDKSPELVQSILAMARTYWSMSINPTSGIPFDHDFYLKIWQVWSDITVYQLPYDLVFLDEAQDSNQLACHIFLRQRAQLVAVGDQAQTMYAWRGAIDAMSRLARVPGTRQMYLSESFRFGSEIAGVANQWLMALDNPFLLSGRADIDDRVGEFDRADPYAVLCRTNGGVLSEAMGCVNRGESFHIVGGTRDMAGMAKALGDLKAGKKSSHPQVCAFEDWAQITEYVGSEMCDDSNLVLMVSLLSRYSAAQINMVLARSTDRDRAKVVLSTTHKFKGDEHDRVRIGVDYPDGGSGVGTRPEDIMAAYVAVTRAKRFLDEGSLGWIWGYNEDRDTEGLWRQKRDMVYASR